MREWRCAWGISLPKRWRMTDIIDKAARAAIEAMRDGAHALHGAYIADEDIDDTLIDGRVDMRAVIRAVLQAIREPSEAMAKAGSVDDPAGDWTISDYEAKAVWQAMIDAALGEG